MTDQSHRDVFISYSRGDRAFAARLASDLQGYGLTVWWDQWEIRVGDSLTEKIQTGMKVSSWLAVILSPHSVGSQWVKRELGAALNQEITSDRVIVLPLLVAECEMPPFLKDKSYADFRSSYRDGLTALLRRLSPPIRPEVASALLSDDESQIRRAWVKLPTTEHERYTQFLSACLARADSQSRLSALFALATLRDDSLRLHLTKMLSDSSPAVRQRVAFYLGRLRRREMLPAIETLMQDSNPTVRSAARTAFKAVRGVAP